MSNIKVMDEILANKIAAGEVIEKCVSIVKELVENSIDAKSSNIRVDLINSGVTEIKVTDDGVGMDHDDAVLAFQRHATSKLKSEDDGIDYNYIDLLAIVQVIKSSSSETNTKQKKMRRKKAAE